MTATEATMREENIPVVTDKDDYLAITLSRPHDAKDVIVVRLAGHIDYLNSRYFGRQLRHLLSSGETRYVLDCTPLTYMSSTGVGELVGFYREVRMGAGRIVLAGMPARVLDVLRLLGFGSFFVVAGTVSEAVDHLMNIRTVTAFPTFQACPICGQKLRVTREGRFRCPECRTIVQVTAGAEIVLG